MKITMSPTGRYMLDVTRYEACLIKDAIYDFAQNRSEAHEYDSLNDPVVVAQMQKCLDREKLDL